jgi:DnaJ-domain-containing protein 1
MYLNGLGKRAMIRFAIIIIFVVMGYLIFSYLMGRFKRELSQRDERDGQQYQNRRHANAEEKYRQILGVTIEDDLTTIRKKYRELLAKYHPDKVQHLGMEFQEMAERKTKIITEAYEFFQKKYNR